MTRHEFERNEGEGNEASERLNCVLKLEQIKWN